MKKTLLASFLLACTFMNSQINLGSGTTTGLVPIYTFNHFSYSQQIISKANINAAGAGTITGLQFYQSSTATLANSNEWKVYLGTTTKTAFSSTTDWIPVSSLTEVFAGTVSSSSGVITVNFTTPFSYDNIDNLVIAVDENKAGYETSTSSRLYVYSATTNGALYASSDTVNPDPTAPPTGILYSSRSRMTLLGINNPFSGSCPTVSAPAANATNTSLSPTFTWAAVTGATGYKLTIGTQPGTNDILNNFETGNVTTYTLPTVLNPQTKYYYTITSHDATTTSTGCTERNFTTTFAPPANDDCSGAINVSSFPYNYSQTDGAGSTNNAGFIMTCGTGMNDGLWFKFKGNGSKITVKATPTGWDPELAVYTGTCGNFTCAGSSDAGGTGTAETVVITASTMNADYFVNVGNWSGSTNNLEGPFVIDITTDAVLASNDISKSSVKIYPNPFNDIVNISDITNVKDITISDFSGRSVKTMKAAKAMSLTDLKSGSYILSLNYEDGTVKAMKVIKK